MKNLKLLCCLLLTVSAFASTYYVGKGKPGINYYTDIQSAVDVASDGDLIIVSNGTYVLTDQIEVEKLLTIQSVDGAALTIIDGSTSNRCFRLSDTNIVIDGFTIMNGDSDYNHGGGIYCESGLPIIKNCIIKNNHTYNWGGGIRNGTVYNCIIDNNLAGYGGGLYGSIVYNSSIANNIAESSGGGINSATAVNCTIVNNHAYSQSGSGGGARDSLVVNSIVYYNYAEADPNRNFCHFSYCCTTPDATNGVGNISEEPMLLSCSHIATNSPCIGAGSYASIFGADIDGEAWKNPPSIGCDEVYLNAISGNLSVNINAKRVYTYIANTLSFDSEILGKLNKCTWDFGDGKTETDKIAVDHYWKNLGDYDVILTAFNDTYPAGISATTTVHIIPKTHYVNKNNSSPELPFSTWETAATNIQAAVDIADDNCCIIITNGTYYLSSPITVDKEATIKSVNGPEKTVCVGNSYSVFYLKKPNVLLVGITITNGNWNSGGGVYCYDKSDIVSNCFILGNTAAFNGGGVYGGTINSCVINNNIAEDGGGVANSYVNDSLICNNTASASGGGSYNSTINNCIISNNTSSSGGGSFGGEILNSEIIGNHANNSGGGTWVCAIINCSIIGNSASDGGGVCYGAITNCLIEANTATDEGGGVYFEDGDLLINCTVVGNNADQPGGGIVCKDGGTIINSIIYNNQALNGEQNWKVYSSNVFFGFCCTTPTNNLPGGTQCVPDDPMFANPGSDYTLQDGSPCIDVGYKMDWMDPPATDLAGNPRLHDGQVDMGCYEFIPEPGAFGAVISYLLLVIGIGRKFNS